MSRGYLNDLSFPASSVDEAMHLLSQLRVGIAMLRKEGLLSSPVMCNVRASELAIAPQYEVLASGLHVQGGRFRDTVAFFLSVLDQRTPAYAALDARMADDVMNHVAGDWEGKDTGVLVACALDDGVLLSISTDDPWGRDRIAFSAVLGSTDILLDMTCNNVADASTAEVVATRLRAEKELLIFTNWDYLTQSATRAPQLDEWFEEARTRPGLEALIMRSVALAARASYRIDGDLIKKLNAGADPTVFEVRAFYNGSNNVRLLFGRNGEGRICYGFGGIKTSGDWYDHAIPQAMRFISKS